MAAASSEHAGELDLGAIARIWRGGCIIRARLLNRMREAYAHDAALANLMLDPYFAALLAQTQDGLREAIVLAARRGIAAPALGSRARLLRRLPIRQAAGHLIQASATTSAPIPTSGSTGRAAFTATGRRSKETHDGMLELGSGVGLSGAGIMAADDSEGIQHPAGPQDPW